MIVALWGEYTKSWQWRWCWWNLHKLINGWHRVPIVDTWWRLRSVKVADAWNPPLVMMMLEEEQEEEEEEEMNSLLNLLASSFPSTNSFHSSRLASAVPANPVKMSLVPPCRLFWTSLNVVSLCSAPGDGSQLQVEKTRVRLTCSWLVDHLKSGAAIVSQTLFLKLFWVAIEVGSNYLSLILFSNRVQIANYSSGTTQFGELLLKLDLQEEELPSVPACLQSCPADQPE